MWRWEASISDTNQIHESSCDTYSHAKSWQVGGKCRLSHGNIRMTWLVSEYIFIECMCCWLVSIDGHNNIRMTLLASECLWLAYGSYHRVSHILGLGGGPWIWLEGNNVPGLNVTPSQVSEIIWVTTSPSRDHSEPLIQLIGCGGTNMRSCLITLGSGSFRWSGDYWGGSM
jgi:hypothetical protein